VKTNVTAYDFLQSFKDTGRNVAWSRPGLLALFDYIEELEDSTGHETELCVVGLDSEYAEYRSLEQIQGDYSHLDGVPQAESIDEVAEILKWEGYTAIPFDDGVVIGG